jgi:hypothetical protein
MVGKTFYPRDFQDNAIYQGASKVSVTGAALLTNGMTVFTITGGFIRITDLFSVNVVDADAVAATIQWSADGTLGSAVTITAASASVASVAPGGIVNCDFTTLATAPVIAANGVALQGPTAATGGSVIIPAGVLTLVIGSGPTTASTWMHIMKWDPLGSPEVTVTPAF